MLLYDPIIESVKPNEDNTGFVVKWKPVNKATKYEVRVADYDDMAEWTYKYNENIKDNDDRIPYDTPRSFNAVAKLITTTKNTKCTVIPEKRMGNTSLS